MAIGSSLGIILPTQGGNSGTWGSDLNAEITKIVDAIEAQVPVGAVDFSTNVLLGDVSIKEASAVSFLQKNNITANNSVYFSATGELMVVDGASNQVQLTANGVLNSASLAGLGNSGLTYGSNGVIFDWDGFAYNAKNGSGSDAYAPIRVGEVRIHDGSTNDLTLKVDPMGSNHSVTLPGALPANKSLVSIDATGALDYNNTVANDIAFSSNISVAGTSTLQGQVLISGNTTTGDVFTNGTFDVTGTANVTGQLTCSSSVYSVGEIIAPAGINVYSAAVKYSPRTSVIMGGSSCISFHGSANTSTLSTNWHAYSLNLGTIMRAHMHIPSTQGETIQSIILSTRNNDSTIVSGDVSLIVYNDILGTEVVIGTYALSTTIGDNLKVIALPVTPANNEGVRLQINVTTFNVGEQFLIKSAVVSYTQA